ncbi:MAG: YihY/virulence factor BrkB family protein [Salinarimonas sp.]
MARARKILAVLNLAYDRFLLHDGWAIASHIALSALFSFFPFLILLTSLASTFEFGTLADNATDIILDVLPVEIAEPLAAEVRTVLTEWRGDLLTIGAALALWFSSNGIEALRVGLNRAYGVRENRAWYVTRLESIVFVVIVAAVMMVFSLAVVLGPLLWRAAIGFFPALAPFSQIVGLLRLGATSLLIAVALVVTHKFLAAGTRSIVSVLPGVAVTLVLWTVGGLAFGFYLAQFPSAYASTYGGLATAMMSLIFLYTIAVIFIVGGEINGAAIALKRSAKKSRAARG